MSLCHLRPPIDSDYAILASWIPDFAVCQRWAGPRLPFPFSVAVLPDLLSNANTPAIVDAGASYSLVDTTGQLCGFAQHWVLQPGAVHIGRILVSPHCRGQGYGRRLCQLLITAAVQATGAGKVTLRVYRDNQTALQLYQSLGFTEDHIHSDADMLWMYWQVPG